MHTLEKVYVGASLGELSHKLSFLLVLFHI